MRRLWTDIASASGAKIYALLTGIVTLMLSGRVLGPGGRGTVVAVSTWVALVSTCGYLSLGQVAIHRATGARDRSWLAATFGSLLLLTGVISTASWLGIGLVFAATHGAVFRGIPALLLAIGFLSLPFLIWEQYGSSLLIAIDQIRVYNRAQILGRTVGFVLMILLLWGLRWREAGALAALTIAQLVTSAAGIRILWREAGARVRPDRGEILSLLRGGAKLHLTTIGSFLAMSTDVLVINRYCGPAMTGQYQLAVQLVGILLLIPQSASAVLYSKVTQLGTDAVWPQQRRILILLTIGMTLLGALSAACAPVAIPLVMGRDFAPAVPVFQLMTLNLIGMTFSTVMAPQWIGRGLFVQVSLITLTVGILNFATNCLLVPRYGMYGSLWATIGTYVVAIVANVGMALWVERRTSQLASAPPVPIAANK